MRNIAHAQSALVLLLCLFLAGCGGFIDKQRERDRQAAIEVALKDHAHCEAEGHEFPSIGYTRCRQSLQNQREARQLRALRMIDPDEAGAANDPYHRPTTERGDFRCEERVWGETQWIQCRTYERDARDGA